MKELHFEGRDHLKPLWSKVGLPFILVVLFGCQVGAQAGLEPALVVSGVVAVPIVLLLYSDYRSWSTIGAAGITLRWGLRRAKTYRWYQIRSIAVRKVRGSSTIRFRLHGEDRLRMLPGPYDGPRTRDPELDTKLQQITAWWEQGRHLRRDDWLSGRRDDSRRRNDRGPLG